LLEIVTVVSTTKMRKVKLTGANKFDRITYSQASLIIHYRDTKVFQDETSCSLFRRTSEGK